MLLTRLVHNLTITPVRHRSIWKNYKKMQAHANWEGGIKYKGFTYYPKEGEVDPPYDPSQLFMVQRIKSWKGHEYWCKSVLFDYKLDKEFKQGKVIIVKNTPDNNMRLWKIKHLIKITPITFPDGVPTENDVFSTYLNHRGELRIKKSIDEAGVKEISEAKANPIQLKKDDIKRHTLKLWEQAWKSPFDH